MNELITVKDDGARQFVEARELYVSLGVARDFSTWIKDRIEKYGFVEGADFSPELGESTGGRPGIEYNLSLEMAKELAMVENNDKGREVRRYLISLEKAWNNPEMVMARALQCSQRMIDGYKQEIAIMAPKAAFYDQVADAKNAIDMRSAAAALNITGLGRNNLFEKLRKLEILDNENLPYRRFQDSGYFRVIITRWTDQYGETHANTKTLVYPKGLDFIRKAVSK